MITAIASIDRNWGIGKLNPKTGKGQLLFNIPADLKFFKETTKGKVVVMGYSTYQSLPKKPLPDRVNVVLWDQADGLDSIPGCITFSRFGALLDFVKIIAKAQEVFICGGQSIYNLFLDYFDGAYITKVDAEDKEATAFFPNLDNDDRFFEALGFELEERDPNYAIEIVYYKRK